MATRILALLGTITLTVTVSAAEFPTFKVQEIAKDLKIGYAVHVCDVNGDGKPDIVVVDKERVIWYENPTWKMRTITAGKTQADNVTLTMADLDGDGKLDFILGAGWKPTDPKTPGTLQWFSRGKTLDDEWTLHPIPCDEPTVHRIRMATIAGKPHLIVAPLQGRDSTAKGGWVDGRPVRIMAYPIPKDPTTPANWKPFPISEDLHVVHNFWPMQKAKVLSNHFLAVSYEGVFSIELSPDNQWTKTQIGSGNQENPKGSRGASEIRAGMLKTGKIVGTIEPWHGNQVVVYTPDATGKGPLVRKVVDRQLRWGHAIAFADLDGDGVDEMIVGVRDNPDAKAGDTFTEKFGVRVYKNTDGKGENWDRLMLDEGGVAVEDLTVADLDGDGKPDIIAVGRATKNVRIYWNKGK